MVVISEKPKQEKLLSRFNQSKMDPLADPKPEPVAIVGSSCRFPGGASSPSKLWALLSDPRDVLTEMPPTRFNPDGFYHENGECHGSTNVTKSYLLEENPRVFDHSFFNIHPKEAEAMDPQQRLLLETVYEGIESAGYSVQELKGSPTAVYVGQMTADYYDVLLRDVDSAPQYLCTGTSRSIMANRVSYFFDWKGPSITIDTACSSSLVALHQAVQTLRLGESMVAVAAGVNLILGPEPYIFESKLHMLSPTGRSRMWDADADGYARGEGFGTTVLKTLKQAIIDNDDIECVIRETGVNQDGRTTGITMPNAASQAALVKSTYARCGLDCSKKADQCQYFEAHGTGTLAGDPVEARAIRDVFFPESESNSADMLFVGSVKTVIGHLEGTAGLAGVLKASLALQHGVIPPNMHFDRLNPAIEPYYDNLRVPTESQCWPVLPEGAPRRASVNSFGFGGTNAHAILESWEPRSKIADSQKPNAANSTALCGPVTISAFSERALMAAISSLSCSLKAQQLMDLGKLTWTLQNRRSQFQFKASFAGSDREQLLGRLDDAVSAATKIDRYPLATKAIQTTEYLPPRILAVFTGQGAQWPSMGAGLYEKSKLFRGTIQWLDDSLRTLPDAPTWSLTAELVVPAERSRVHEAAISQPLCAALQIALVDLLRASGISFSAVLGHSSGEIAAAYAAGCLSATDAIRIAYYRGLHAHRAQGQQGQPGKMMAVGMVFTEAQLFCERDEFAGRIAVAASNAKSSVTVSGDADAIDEAKRILDQEKLFARVLKVNTAYHSHHMEPCAGPYLASLRSCDIRARASRDGCNWYSSVHGPNGRSIDDQEALKDQYWVDNMVRPVLFSQALERAVAEEHCHDIVLEVGPHPALKGPSTESVKALTGVNIPYAGVLARGEDDMRTFSDALGFVWRNFMSPFPVVDFEGFRVACFGDNAGEVSVLKNLPRYSWDHDHSHWKESRRSRQYRTREKPVHELLGTAVSNGNNNEMRWRNVMKLSEMEWLRGHQFQNQVLFPAAGYIVMAYEACLCIAAGQTIQLVELEDLAVHHAITLDEDSAGAEVTFVIRQVDRSATQLTTEYTCYSGGVDGGSQDFESINFTGRAVISLGSSPNPDALPPRRVPKLPMTSVDVSRFYSSLADIGLRYSGNFLVDSVRRRLNLSTVTLKRLEGSKFRVHPATLDAAFHGLFAAFSAPGDDRLWTHYLPTSIRRVRVGMLCTRSQHHRGSEIVADCHLRSGSARTICGDVDIYCGLDDHPEIQVHAITCSSFSKPTAEDDRKLFAQNVWKPDVLNPCALQAKGGACPEDMELIDICERTSYFFLRKLRSEIASHEIPSMEWHFQCLMDWVLGHLLPKIEAGRHSRVKPEWASDTWDVIAQLAAKYPGQIDLEIILAVGEALPSIVRGKLPILQVMMENDMLNRLYKYGIGFNYANEHLATVAAQISHRYPRMNVLEVGAGTGGATASVLKGAANQFLSYTYTDVSPGFFESAQSLFKENTSKMKYKVLDIESDPIAQGFEEHSFDVIVASNVLHATKVLANTMANCRRLLKPGGYLLLLEITSDTLRPQFVMSGLPGWWLGRDDGRTFHPTITEAQWESLLQRTGFSGVDTVRRDFEDPDKYLCSVMTSQAVDERVAILREPLSFLDKVPPVNNLVIVGGETLAVAKIARQIGGIFRTLAGNITVVNKLDELDTKLLPSGTAVICLSDLEEPAFKDITPERLRGMQALFRQAKYLLWITQGCRDDNPYSNMVVGVGRSILLESPHVRFQFVDIDSIRNYSPEPTMFSEALIRIVCLDIPEFNDILWSDEHEVAVEEGYTLIPRILPNYPLNDRLNSEKRPVTKSVSPRTTAVEITEQRGSLLLQEAYQNSCALHCETIQVRVHLSSVFPVATSDSDHVFLCVGSLVESDQTVLAFSRFNCSLLSVPTEDVLAWSGGANDAERLRNLLRELLVESFLLCEPDAHGQIWVHGADAHLAVLTSQAASRRGVDVFLSTSLDKSDPTRTFIHPYTTDRDLELVKPAGIQKLVNLDRQRHAALSNLLQLSVPKSACIEDEVEIVDERRTVVLRYGRLKMLEIAIRYCSAFESKANTLESSSPSDPVGLEDVANLANNMRATDVISWTNTSSVPLEVGPVNAHGLFSDHKTYFLVGLTGELGLSLCDWMATHGARYLAITSRNPRVDPEVVESLQRRGVQLRIFSLDITDKRSLADVHDEVRETMPPIGGVANAAMVLRDRSFDNMSFDDFEAVLKPKVDGSRNLDEVFHSDNLDFFVLFSSLACVIGNRGQSNYNSANMFMASLACQRRKRGVPASIIDIGMLLGVGYVARSGDIYEAQLKKYRYMSLSEPEFHHIFAEAIVAGRPESGQSPELITGLEPTDLSKEDMRSPWHRNPRFAHYVYENGDIVETKQQTQSMQSVQGQLRAANNNDEALLSLEGSFSKKLELILQVPAEKMDKTVALMTLGIDSLVAVEIRSWFLKELTIDMPVLRILSGASLSDLCKDALARLPDELRPSKSEVLVHSTADGATKESPPQTSDQSNGDSSTSRSDSPVTQPEGTIDTPMEPTPSRMSDDQPFLDQIYQRTGEMSHGQARLYFLNVYLEDKSTYNVTFSGTIRGPLDIHRLEAALHAVAEKHDVLRSAFFTDNKTAQPVQTVNSEPRILVQHKGTANDAEVADELNALKNFEFKLDLGQSMKVIVLTQSRSVNHILFGYHHIILDGISWLLFLRDLNKAYSLQDLGAVGQQAIDLSEKQRRDRTPAKLQSELRFWSEAYRNYPESLPLFPFSKVSSRQVLRAYDTRTFDVKLDSTWTRLVKQKSSELQITSFHFYLAALAAFISCNLSVSDFRIGILDANRTEAEDAEVLGFFLNLLPVRFRLDPSERFDKLARQTRDNVFSALANSRAPFDVILDHLKVSRSGNQSPLFQIAVNYRLGDSYHSPLGDCDIQWENAIAARNPYDLTVDITETPGGITLLSFTTQSYLYSAPDTQRMMKWYQHVLESLAANPSTPVADCSPGNAADIKQALTAGLGDNNSSGWPDTLAHKIDEVMAAQPGLAAVKDGSAEQLTYAEMMARAYQIARVLRQGPIKSVSHVAVLLTPVSDIVCSLLAIMRLGLVYVPLDLRNPLERLAAIVSDSKPSVIVCHDETESQAQELAGNWASVINISRARSSTREPVENVAVSGSPAFILYTSGSTGTPKGVLLTHGGFANQISAISERYGVGREVVLQQSALGFDMSLEQIFSALANGGTVIIVSKEARGDPNQIAGLMLAEGVTYTEFVPSEYLALLRYGSAILRRCSSWRLAFSGGEKITEQLRQGFRRLHIPKLLLINVYGPTEVSLSCTRGVVPYRESADQAAETNTSVGQVLPNYSVNILDAVLKPVPAGYPGEICIGGKGVSLGYANRPDETKRRFIPDQLAPAGRGWTTLYRSGDKGRILEDGSVHFLGRLDGDSQVKIRGIRIELDEIANVIIYAAHPAIVEAAVSVRGSSDVLVAFVVFASDFTGSKTELLERLRNRLPLPSYMCPAFFVPIDQIPRNPNGKRDRSALQNLSIPAAPTELTADETLTEMESRLKKMWEKVLPPIARSLQLGPDSDFFHVGGNSLLLLQLQSAVKEEIGSKVSLAELFQASTIRGMAKRVSSQEDVGSPVGAADLERDIFSVCASLPDSSGRASGGGAGMPKEGRIAVLTGATGFLGRHILRCLVDDEHVQEVHCIAIRPDGNGNPRNADIRSPKVVEYTGNLEDRYLGLSDREFQRLTNRAHLIIHNGADVSFLKSYASLRRPNVLSFLALVEMAIPQSIPIHFISTASVAHFADLDSLPEVSVSKSPPPAGTLDGYTMSKWTGEGLLERVAADYGLRAWVHRPASVVGDGAPETDMMASLVKYSTLLRAVPKLEGLVKGSFDFVAVEDVSREVANTALTSWFDPEAWQLAAGPPGIRVQHHCNDSKVPIQGFKGYVEGIQGGEITVLEMEQWIGKAREKGMNALVADYLWHCLGQARRIALPAIHREVRQV
jgi:amino acid adenylation domain-containing protein